ncbi:hypothetical protein [Mangrovibacterium sp.]|uniref:hypothetical protein n=1 Tax=Mangrovibacterium sp. TaxID=1961364 RepID=UPI003564C7D7
MLRKLKLILLVLMVSIGKVYPQDSFPLQVNNQLNRYILGNIQEKLYVQTNSGQYYPGDSIWLKATLVNAINHVPLGSENLIYIDLISPENKMVSHEMFPIDRGFTDGFVALNHKLPAGKYKLLAYTNYMCNYASDFLFQKPIVLLPKGSDRTQWEFSSRVVPFVSGDSVFVKIHAQSPEREINEEVAIRVQLARGTMLGATCMVRNNEGRFSFAVPDSLKLPVALISVNQNGKANGGEKHRIKLSVQKPDLQFLPEGGELVADQENVLAFRCIDSDGNPMPVSGELRNNDGSSIARFSSEYQGLGSIKITPRFGQNYQARINFRDSVFTYELPQIKEKAYCLRLLEQSTDSLRFAILKNSTVTANYLLVGHCRGNTKFMSTGILNDNYFEFAIPTDDFPEGIITFTLFVNRIPRAERLVYHDKNNDIQFKLINETAGEKPGSPLRFMLQANHADGRPAQGNFSFLAWNPLLESSLDSLENIRNYVLFSSDLQGEVLANTAVFNPTDPARSRKRDLMLLTYGWRRFTWADVAGFTNETPTHEPEPGIFMNGRIYRKASTKPVPKNFEVSIILIHGKSTHIDKAYTNENGQFSFTLPAFTDSASLTIQTKNRWDNQKDYIIDLTTNLEHLRLNSMSFEKISKRGLSPLVLNLPPTNYTEQEHTTKDATVAKPGSPNIRKPRIDNYYFPGKDTFMIEEVVARSNFLNRRDSLIAQSGQPDVVIESAQLKKLTEETAWYSDLWDLLADQVPGLKIEKGFYDPRIAKNSNLVITNQSDNSSSSSDGESTFSGTPAVYFNVAGNPDGYLYIFVDKDFLNNNSFPLYDFLSYMDPSEIETINFIAKPQKYGIDMPLDYFSAEESMELINSNLLQPDEEENSDIMETTSTDQEALMESLKRSSAPPSYLFITTKSKAGIFYQRTKGLQTLFLTGLSPQREFYVPRYQNSSSSNQARKTIFWQPQIVTDSTGSAQIAFPTGAGIDKLNIQVQGITASGESGSNTFSVALNNHLKEEPIQPQLAENKQKPSTESLNPYQSLRLYSGIITDAESGKPIPSADLIQQAPFYHERTNNDGEFFLSSDRLQKNAVVLVSGPGYQSRQLTLPAQADSILQIKLEKTPVLTDPNAGRAVTIVRNAIQESRKLYASDESYQGYNRETVAIDQDVFGIYEMAFNYSNAGYPGSTGAMRFETVKFKNMEDKSGHRLMLLKPNHRSSFYPLKADVLAATPEFWRQETSYQFDYDLIGQIEYDGELCYKIQFRQKSDLVVALQSGVLYIGTETEALRYASWTTSPDKRKYLSYISYLQSNPMEYDVQVTDDLNEVNYSLVNGKLRLLGSKSQIQILVNDQTYLQFENQLSVVGMSQRNYKDIQNQTTDQLIEDEKANHMMIKDAQYRIDPWVNLGIVKPEKKLIEDAKFLHDITMYQ